MLLRRCDVNIALRSFLHKHGNIATKEARSGDYVLHLSKDFKGSL